MTSIGLARVDILGMIADLVLPGILPSEATSSPILGTDNLLLDTANFILDMGLFPSEAISSLLGKTIIIPLGDTVKLLLDTVMSIKNLLMDTGMSIMNSVMSITVTIILGKLVLGRHILHSHFFIRLLQENEFILGVGSNDDATELWLHRCCV